MLYMKIFIVERIDPPYDHEIINIFESKDDAVAFIARMPKTHRKMHEILERAVVPCGIGVRADFEGLK